MTAPTAISSRPYAGASDLLRMEQFLSTAAIALSPYLYWHIGDLLWTMHYSPTIDPTESARLWESTDGELLGFAWCDESGEVAMQVQPGLRGSGLIEDQMLAWAAHRVGLLNGEGPPGLAVFVDEDDAAYIALLMGHGFARGSWRMVRYRYDVCGPVPGLSVPASVTIRPVAGEDEYVERVDAHRQAFHPSQFTVDAYRRLRAAPGYRPDLDLIAVTSEGVIAAYCICWFDAETRIGLFEPVGTKPAFQQRGIGSAVTREGLRRLRELDADVALLSTGAAAVPARRLYESIGFTVVAQQQQYRKGL